jgi:hypothetical protein
MGTFHGLFPQRNKPTHVFTAWNICLLLLFCTAHSPPWRKYVSKINDEEQFAYLEAMIQNGGDCKTPIIATFDCDRERANWLEYRPINGSRSASDRGHRRRLPVRISPLTLSTRVFATNRQIRDIHPRLRLPRARQCFLSSLSGIHKDGTRSKTRKSHSN